MRTAQGEGLDDGRRACVSLLKVSIFILVMCLCLCECITIHTWVLWRPEEVVGFPRAGQGCSWKCS